VRSSAAQRFSQEGAVPGATLESGRYTAAAINPFSRQDLKKLTNRQKKAPD
jgi:hypothetical protein